MPHDSPPGNESLVLLLRVARMRPGHLSLSSFAGKGFRALWLYVAGGPGLPPALGLGLSYNPPQPEMMHRTVSG